jgi:signal transduction histidine kinase
MTRPAAGCVVTSVGRGVTYFREPVRVLADVVAASSEAGDLRAILGRLAELTLEATEADRVSYFLSDDARGSIELFATAARKPDEQLWQRALHMPAITLDDEPVRRGVFEGTVPVAVGDAAGSPIVPAEWVNAFRLASLVVAPLRAGDEPLGLLVVDYHERRSLTGELVELVGAIARSSALSVRGARLSAALADRAVRLESLVEASRLMVTSRSLTEVADHVAAAVRHVLGAYHLSVHLLDREGRRYRTLTQRGVRLPEQGDVMDLPRWATARVAKAWRRPPAGPVLLADLDRLAGRDDRVPAEIRSALALPLLNTDGGVFGFVLAGFSDPTPPAIPTVELAGALAGHISVVVDRAQLEEQLAIGAELARTLLALDDLGGEGAEGLLAGVFHAVPPAIGFRVTDVRIGGNGVPRASRLAGADVPGKALWQRWRRRKTRPALAESDGNVYAAIWGAGRALGLVRAEPLRGSLASHERDLLEMLVLALGEALERHRMRRMVRARERELAIAEERTRIVAELNGHIGAFLGMVTSSAADLAARLPPGELAAEALALAALASAGAGDLRDGEVGAEAAGYHAGGIAATIGEVVGRLGQRLDAVAGLRVEGRPRPLPAPVEQALLRVVHEILSRVERHGRASGIAVVLAFRSGEVEMSVRDDGVDLMTRENHDGAPSAHFGLRLARHRVEELGGRLSVERSRPRGVRVTASIPA